MNDRAIWVDANNDADETRLLANGIVAPYFDIRDPRLTKPYLKRVRVRLPWPGVYAASNWPGVGDTGDAFAEWLSATLEPLAKGTAPDFPAVCVDIEGDDMGYVVAFLTRWRQLRPRRVTDWTLEGHKGGLFTPALVVAVLAAHVRVVPQCYNGDLTEVWDSLTVARDLTAAGIPDAYVVPFFDAAHLPKWWSGYAFTQGRLP